MHLDHGDRLSDWRSHRRHDGAAARRELTNWRTVFVFGAIATAGFIPLVCFLCRSRCTGCRKQPAGALKKINRTLANASVTRRSRSCR